MSSKNNFLVGLIFLILPLVSGCSAFKPLRIETVEKTVVYDDLFPFHVEICALSRIKPREGTKGARTGHAVMYLEGACRDEHADFPKLELCNGQNPGATRGVGISVNKMFRNVNWVAVPGQEFFYFGGLSQSDLLDEELAARKVDEAVQRGIFRGVEIHERYKEKSYQGPLERYIAQKSLGTDYALNFGRSILCMKVPVTREMMGKIIDYLNSLNQKYAVGGEEYRWNVLSDNCTHTIYNSLASADMMSPKMIHSGRIRKFFNIAVPANAVAETVKLADSDPISDIRKIQKDKRQRAALEKYGWLPFRHGAILTVQPPHANNKIYEIELSHFETLFTRTWTFKSNRERLRRAFSDDRLTDLETNLKWFEFRYQIIQAYCHENPSPKRLDQAFYRTYCGYIQDRLESIRLKRQRLSIIEDVKSKTEDNGKT